MRFKLKPEPHFGTIREIRKFLLFPKCLNNEIRWLEYVNIRQCYKSMPSAGTALCPNYKWKWIDIQFLN